MTIDPGPGRAWNTWDFRYPGCFLHLPSRLALRVSAYSGKENRFEDFDVDGPAEIELGEHATDGSYAALRLHLAGTVLGVEFAKPDPSSVVARIRVLEQGEILFRFLPLVEFGFLDAFAPEGELVQDPEARVRLAEIPEDRQFETPSRASASSGGETFALAIGHRPIGASAYPDRDGLRSLLEEEGWLRNPTPVREGRWAGFRFLGDPLVNLHVAVAQGTDSSEVVEGHLARAAEVIQARRTEALAEGSEAERAVRDVMAWNTIADARNERVHTCLSRRWVRGLGGWGVWLTDVLYAALMDARTGDDQGAVDNLSAVFAGQQDSGILPCLVAEHEQWIDRSQLPIAATMLWRVYLLTGDADLLARWYPALVRHLDWWRRERDGNGNGLYEYGSSPVGLAHNTHTRQGAMNESGMDNLQTFDDAVFHEETDTLDLEDVGLNALLSLETQMLARIARELGHEVEAAALEADAEVLNERIRTELWDPEREVFAGRLWERGLIGQIAPTSFFPLAAGAATEDQARALVEQHLLNPDEFWGEFVLPTAPFDDSISSENSYWRGRIWPPHVFFTWEGLRRYGFDEVAAEVARRSWAMFRTEWRDRRRSYEHFHIRDREGHENPDADPFYSWGALIPLIAACEMADASPWTGVTLGAPAAAPAPAPAPDGLAPDGLATGDPADHEATGWLPGSPGDLSVRQTSEALVIAVGGEARLAVRPPARLREVRIEGDDIGFRLPGEGAGSFKIRALTGAGVAGALVDGEPVEVRTDDGWTVLTVEVPGETTGPEVRILGAVPG